MKHFKPTFTASVKTRMTTTYNTVDTNGLGVAVVVCNTSGLVDYVRCQHDTTKPRFVFGRAVSNRDRWTTIGSGSRHARWATLWAAALGDNRVDHTIA